MLTRRTIVIISSMVIGLAVTAELIGWGRTAMFFRCQWWHAMHEPELRFRELQVRVPLNWFPIQQEETLMLSMIPSSRSSRIVMLLFSSISDQDKRRLMSGANFPKVMMVRGDTFQLKSGPFQLDISGMAATRLHYVSEDETKGGESLMIWLFPAQDVSALSYKVHRADIEHLDQLVSTFTPNRGH